MCRAHPTEAYQDFQSKIPNSVFFYDLSGHSLYTAFLDPKMLIVKFPKNENISKKTNNRRYCIKNSVLRVEFFRFSCFRWLHLQISAEDLLIYYLLIIIYDFSESSVCSVAISIYYFICVLSGFLIYYLRFTIDY